MPVGTQATVKAQLPQTLEDAGAQIVLANTYHLLLRPGQEVFRRRGGIHRFMTWPRSVLTDSGGFQIFSLPDSRAMSEEGASFQSYLDGRTILLSPELSIEMQRAIGSDIMMVLDQCVPSTADEATARAAVGITHRWALRSLDARDDSPQSLFAIVQGALFKELRRESAERLCELPFDGFAIGGLAVGEAKNEREAMCDFTTGLMPHDKPRYLMGVGTPLDILEAVHRGVDMFDCIMPTQVAQRGGVFTSRGVLQLRRGVYRFSEETLDPACPCPTCARFSRAYLHHLTKSSEPLGWQLLGQHNTYFYQRLMREIRESILANRFLEYYREKRELLNEDDLDNPPFDATPRKKSVFTMGTHEVHTAPEGFVTIRDLETGEPMHARPPLERARALFLEPSGLAGRLRKSAHLPCANPAQALDSSAASPDPRVISPLVLWDIGLGTAATAMAVIQCYEELAASGPLQPLLIVSFENSLDPLRLAGRHNKLFPFVRHPGPAGILKKGRWQSKEHPGLTWVLVFGNFLETIAHAPAAPDVVFYDPPTGPAHSRFWTEEAFGRLAAACDGRSPQIYTDPAFNRAQGNAGAHGIAACAGNRPALNW